MLHRIAKRRIVPFILLVAFMVAAYVGIGHLDALIPGEQMLFLTPDGGVVALNRKGDKVLATSDSVRPFATTGQIPMGPLHVWGSWAVAPVRSGEGVGLLVRPADLKGTTSTLLALPADAREFQWVGDALCFLSSAGVNKVAWSNSAAPEAVPTIRTSVLQPGTWAGLFAASVHDNWKLVAWQGNQLWIGDTLSGSVTFLDASHQVRSAGLDSAGHWVAVTVDGQLVWSNSQAKPVVGSDLKVLWDATGKGVLLWDRPSGNLWRATPDKQVLLARSLSGVTTSVQGSATTTLLLGGTLASGVRASGDGFEHLGTFHHLRSSGIGDFRMDPPWVSSVSPTGMFTFSFMGEVGANWNLVVVDPTAREVGTASGKTTETGIVTKNFAFSASLANGTCFAYLDLHTKDSVYRDTIAFTSDWTAPVGKVNWGENATVSPLRPLQVDLSNVLDDNSQHKAVFLEAQWGDNSFRVRKPVSGAVSISPKNPKTGAWLPEGKWDVQWYLVDSLGNKAKITDAPVVTIRTTLVQARATFAPTFVAGNAKVAGNLRLELSGALPASKVSASVFVHDTLKASGFSGTTNSQGVLSLLEALDLGIRPAGICTLLVRGRSGVDSFATHAMVVVGTPQPQITWPSTGALVDVEEALSIQGIAPDLWSSQSGNAVYRVSVHRGTWLAPSRPQWSDLSASGGKLLAVTVGQRYATDNRLSLDRGVYPGSIGRATSLGQAVALATLGAADVDTGTATLVLWVGKGDSLRTTATTIVVKSHRETPNASFALERRSVVSRVDRSNADTADDHIVWALKKGDFPTVDLTVRCGIDGKEVWRKAGVTDTLLDYRGVDGWGKLLPDNSCVLRMEGNLPSQTASREQEFAVVTEKQKIGLKVAANFDVSLALLTGRAGRLPISITNPQALYYKLTLQGENGQGDQYGDCP